MKTTVKKCNKIYLYSVKDEALLMTNSKNCGYKLTVYYLGVRRDELQPVEKVLY